MQVDVHQALGSILGSGGPLEEEAQQPILFLPRESMNRGLVGHSLQGCTELDTTKVT